jgi:hypothetical protein
MRDLSDFERGRIIGACLDGASVTETATLLSVLRMTVSKVVSIHESQEDIISKKEQWAKINTDRKRSSYIEDCFEKSQSHCSTGDRAAELNIHHEEPVSTRTVRHGLHKSNIHSRAAIAKPLIIESNVQMHEQWCHDHKTWTSDNSHVLWSDESSFTLFPTSGRVYIWKIPKEPYNPECLVPTVKHWGRFCDGLGSNIMV